MGLAAPWEQRASPGEQAASSLPLAWHEMDRRLALQVSEGRTTPAPLRPPALASPSPPPTAVAPRADRNRRPGAWREALDLPAAGAGCSGAAGETLGLEVVRSGLRSNGVTRPWRFSSAHPSQLCQTRGSPGPSCTGSEPSPWQVAPASFPDPSLFLARRLPLSRGHLPFPPSSASRFHASLGRSKVS